MCYGTLILLRHDTKYVSIITLGHPKRFWEANDLALLKKEKYQYVSMRIHLN